jgi:hypothetical protein
MARTGWNIKRGGYSLVGPAIAEQVVVFAEMSQGLYAGENYADNYEIFAHPAERLAVRHSVPSLDHPGPGNPEIHKRPAPVSRSSAAATMAVVAGVRAAMR